MTMRDPKMPYFLKIFWKKNDKENSQILETRAAAKVLEKLEREGIKGTFQLEG